MGDTWSGEYWARKGPVALALWRKRATVPGAAASPLPVLVLVHGSSFSSRPAFDLLVPGRSGYSMMEEFAAHGFDVWTLDHEGYGRSSRTEGNADVAAGVEDLRAATDLIRQETGAGRAMLYGLSAGALRAAAFAAAHPDRVERLVLDAFVWTGRGSPTLAQRRERLAELRASNTRRIDREFLRGIFDRDKPGTTEDGVADALADAELAFGGTVPTGTYLDMVSRLPLVDPGAILAPTLVVRGEHDGIATVEDLLDFFERLPNPDKQFAILPGQAHVTPLGRNRRHLWHVVRAFLTMPTRRDG